MAAVLQSASVERFFVSRMRDFFYYFKVALKQTETLVYFSTLGRFSKIYFIGGENVYGNYLSYATPRG